MALGSLVAEFAYKYKADESSIDPLVKLTNPSLNALLTFWGVSILVLTVGVRDHDIITLTPLPQICDKRAMILKVKSWPSWVSKLCSFSS